MYHNFLRFYTQRSNGTTIFSHSNINIRRPPTRDWNSASVPFALFSVMLLQLVVCELSFIAVEGRINNTRGGRLSDKQKPYTIRLQCPMSPKHDIHLSLFHRTVRSLFLPFAPKYRYRIIDIIILQHVHFGDSFTITV